MVRANALKSLDAKKYPTITFRADTVVKTETGYRLEGILQIHGRPETRSWIWLSTTPATHGCCPCRRPSRNRIRREALFAVDGVDEGGRRSDHRLYRETTPVIGPTT